jgi:hypothetical protein
MPNRAKKGSNWTWKKKKDFKRHQDEFKEKNRLFPLCRQDFKDFTFLFENEEIKNPTERY